MKKKKEKLWITLSALAILGVIVGIAEKSISMVLGYLAICFFCAYMHIKKKKAIIAAQKEEEEKERERRAEELRAAKEAQRAKEAALEAELDAIPEATITAIQDTTKPKFPKVETPFACANITRSTKIDNIFPLVVLDLETTGLSPTKDEIIELSAIKYDVDFEPISKYSVLLKPRKPIPEKVTEINHITNEMVEDCVYFSQIADDFAEYIKGCNVCGHNIAKFDLLFLANNGVVIPEKVRVYDTYRIATYYYERRSGLKLADLCDMYDIPLPQAHRALNDCMATAKVFQRLIKLKSN